MEVLAHLRAELAIRCRGRPAAAGRGFLVLLIVQRSFQPRKSADNV
jgi:hypothetical protein